jgi:hypothetical protein
MQILELLQSKDDNIYETFAPLSAISVELMERLMTIQPDVVRLKPYAMLRTAMNRGWIPDLMYVLEYINPSKSDIENALDYTADKSTDMMGNILSSALDQHTRNMEFRI